MKIEKKYYRQKDLAERYSVSAAYINTLIKRGNMPKPMKWNGVRLWPIELIEKIDREMNEKYIEKLADKWK